MRVELAAALLLAAAPAGAGDVGSAVTFRNVAGASFSVAARGPGTRVVFDSGDSDVIGADWDTVLIQGESPDPAVGFQASRPGAAAWQDLTVHRSPDGRFWAKARLRRAAGPVRLRAVDSGAKADHDVQVFGVEVFADDPAGPGAPAIPSRGPQDPMTMRPPVHGRAEWGAATPSEPYAPDPLPWRVTLHHSDGRHTTTLAQSEAEARFIQDFHIHGRGWNDIAYHFLVDAQGNILEGRPEGTLGAHTLDNNEGNVGIVLLGTYHPPVNDKPTLAQLGAVAALGRYLIKRYGIDPSMLKGHRDYKQTDCPGNYAYAKLDDLRLAFQGLPFYPAPRMASPALPIDWLRAPAFDGELGDLPGNL